MDVFGEMLQRQLEHDKPVFYVIERDDNYLGIRTGDVYFKEYDEFAEGEKELLSEATGNIFEFAAGAGRISLHLQKSLPDANITATDISPLAVEVCKQRGLDNAFVLDMQKTVTWENNIEKPIDTFLVFGNSIGVVDNKQDMINFLNTLWTLSSSKGKVLGDFVDPLITDDELALAYHQRNRENGNPPGLIKIRVRLDQLIGEWFNLWLPTKEEFLEVVHQTPWKVQLYGERMYYFELKK